MTNDEAREVLNRVIAQTSDPDQAARLEIVREYLTNEDFRRALAQHVWELNNRG